MFELSDGRAAPGLVEVPGSVRAWPRVGTWPGARELDAVRMPGRSGRSHGPPDRVLPGAGLPVSLVQAEAPALVGFRGRGVRRAAPSDRAAWFTA